MSSLDRLTESGRARMKSKFSCLTHLCVLLMPDNATSDSLKVHQPLKNKIAFDIKELFASYSLISCSYVILYSKIVCETTQHCADDLM